MANRLKWYKRDPNAALEGMAVLSLEERGAYNTILDLIYTKDGKVLDDDRFLAGWMRVDVRVWKRIRARLIVLEKLYIDGTYLRNSRADAEVSKALLRVASAEEAGRASAAKREAERNAANDLTSTDVERDLQQSTTTTTSTSRPRKPSGSPAPPPSEPRAREARALVDEATEGLSIGLRASLARLGLSTWVSEKLADGFEPVDVVIGLGGAIRTLNGEVPTTPRYFEQPILRAREARLKPLPEAGAVSLAGFTRQVEIGLSLRPGTLAASRGDELQRLHRQFVDKAIGWPDVMASMREAAP